jgi:SAM-dependent methyltransferase
VERYGAETYGDRIAAVYDEQHAARDRSAAVSFLAARAGAGPVLELGIGTGRVALPLAAATGLAVFGIDASERMVEQLRAKRGGDAIGVTMGDFADFALGRTFSLVYVVFNTFFSLLTQDEQVRSFECVGAHLAPGGRFVMECFAPDLGRFDRAQRTGTTFVDLDEVRLDASVHDPVRQIVRTQHIVLREAGVQLFPVAIRYAWPAELDLMARLAGLEREARYDGWDERLFRGTGDAVVTVYRKPGSPD